MLLAESGFVRLRYARYRSAHKACFQALLSIQNPCAILRQRLRFVLQWNLSLRLP